MQNGPTRIVLDFQYYKYKIRDPQTNVYVNDTQHLVDNFLQDLNKKNIGLFGRNYWYVSIAMFLSVVSLAIIFIFAHKPLLYIIPGALILLGTMWMFISTQQQKRFIQNKVKVHKIHNEILKRYYQISPPLHNNLHRRRVRNNVKSSLASIVLTPLYYP